MRARVGSKVIEIDEKGFIRIFSKEPPFSKLIVIHYDPEGDKIKCYIRVSSENYIYQALFFPGMEEIRQVLADVSRASSHAVKFVSLIKYMWAGEYVVPEREPRRA